MPVRVTLREWSELRADREDGRVLRGMTLDTQGQRMAEQLVQSGMLEVLDLRSGLTIRSMSFVGAVQIGNLSIHIQPKIAFDVMLTLFRYAYKLHDLHLYRPMEQSVSEFAFQDLLIQQLAWEADDLLARGLLRRYVRVDEALAFPRGKIDMGRIAQNGGVIEAMLPSIHYPRLEDNLINQVLLAGLYYAVPMTEDPIMRSHLRRTARILELSVSRIQLDLSVLKRLRLAMNRLTTHYMPAITLIEMLLLSTGITLEARKQQLVLPGFLFDMNRFFERLLSRFLHEHLPEYTVHDQYRLKEMMAYAPEHNPKRRQAPTPRPDFVITRGEALISIADAKYRDLWEKALPRDMLYQLAVYALSQGFRGQAIVLYPSIDDSPETQIIDIRDALTSSNKAQIMLRPVNLVKLSQLVRNSGSDAKRQCVSFAEQLVLGDRYSRA